MLFSIYRNRELIARLVKRDLKVRYKSSVLGFLWSIAKPLFLVAIYTFVFDRILKLRLTEEGIPFSMHIMSGLLPWMFFSASSGEAMFSIMANASLIKKVKLPHEVFPIATVMGNLAHFILALPVLFAFMAWYGIPLALEALWLLPLIALQTAIAIAFALLLSALNLFYRDIASGFEVVITAWFYATPILYPVDKVARAFGLMDEAGDFPAWLMTVYMLNPMTPLTIAYRRVLLYASPLGDAQTPPLPEYAAFTGANPDLWLVIWLAISVGTTIVLLIVGTKVFRHYSRFFADEV